jgi:hypothetical protein
MTLAFTGRSLAVRTGPSLVLVLASVLFPVGAAAATPYGHHGGDYHGSSFGDGKFNKNSFIIDSPIISRDVLHIRTANIGGVNINPAGQCKKARHCRIIQRTTVFDP